MAGIKLTHPLVFIAGVVVVVGGFLTWREFDRSAGERGGADPMPTVEAAPPKPPKATEADLAALAAIERRWNDTMQVASRTSRIALPPIVTDLQAQRREAEGADFGECLDRLKPPLVKRMGLEIDDYLDFMQSRSGFREETALRERTEARHMEAMVERGAMAAVLERCTPSDHS